MAQEIDVLVEGGKASAGPPLGPALGPAGVNVMDVVNQINQDTESFEGMTVPVTVIVNDDKTFDIKVGTPPTSALIKEELGIDSGSGMPNLDKVADLTLEQAIKVSKQKKTDLLGKTVKSRTLEVLGTTNSLGITCNGKDARKVQQEIKRGKHDALFDEHS